MHVICVLNYHLSFQFILNIPVTCYCKFQSSPTVWNLVGTLEAFQFLVDVVVNLITPLCIITSIYSQIQIDIFGFKF